MRNQSAYPNVQCTNRHPNLLPRSDTPPPKPTKPNGPSFSQEIPCPELDLSIVRVMLAMHARQTLKHQVLKDIELKLSLWTDATKVLGKPFVAFHLGLIPDNNFKDNYKTFLRQPLLIGAYLVSETHQSLQFLSKRFSTKLDQLCKPLVLEGRNFTFQLCYHKGDFNSVRKFFHNNASGNFKCPHCTVQFDPTSNDLLNYAFHLNANEKTLQYIQSHLRQTNSAGSLGINAPGFLDLNKNLDQQHLEQFKAGYDRLHVLGIGKSIFNKLMEHKWINIYNFRQWLAEEPPRTSKGNRIYFCRKTEKDLNSTQWRKLFINSKQTIEPFLNDSDGSKTEILRIICACYADLAFLCYDETEKTLQKKMRFLVASFFLHKSVLQAFPSLKSSLYLHTLVTHMAENYVKADGVAFADVASDRNEGWFAIAKRVLKHNTNRKTENSLHHLVNRTLFFLSSSDV